MHLPTFLLLLSITTIALSCSKPDPLSATTVAIAAINETRIRVNVSVTGPVNQNGVALEYTNPSTLETHFELQHAFVEANHFSYEVTGLDPGMLYKVRAFAEGEGIIVYGDVLSAYTFPEYCEVNIESAMIGEQCWQRYNRHANYYENGDLIDTNRVNGNFLQCQTGYLYDKPDYFSHAAAGDPRNICGKGWHVPTKAEWDTLIATLGGPDDAGRKLRSYGTRFWSDAVDISFNESGFEAKPAGFAMRGQHGAPPVFEEECTTAQFLIADRPDIVLELNGTSSTVNVIPSSPGVYHSCRCVKDQ